MSKRTSPFYQEILIIGVGLALTGLAFATDRWFAPPADFPTGQVIAVAEGDTLTETAKNFHDQAVIKSPALFKTLVRLFAGRDRVVAGEYWFAKNSSVATVARKVVSGEYGLKPVRITIWEGLTIKDMARLLVRELTDFDGDAFTQLAVADEGYLFPDTYRFLPVAKPQTVIKEMKRNFDEKIESLEPAIAASPRLFDDIVKMASLIEKEARTPVSRRLIAGILWKRLDADMPLQVDAAFDYFLEKNTFELTTKDLQIDSPYNTYRYAGLPPTPIANPGLDAIAAALEPTPSTYWFYLSDRQGNIYYADTFEEHKRNKARYLR